MAAGHATLRVSARSIVLAIAGLGVIFLALRMAVAAERVLGWIAAAASIALLLTPAVERLHRWMPRGLAVLVVTLVTLGGAGLAGYGVGASLVRQYQGVRAAIPQAVERVERSERFGDVARDAKLSQRASEFVDAIPERLRGGEPAEAVRAAATRGVAFVITAILSIFFLLHGPKMLQGALRQLPDHLQERVRRTVGRVGARASRYALLTLAQAVAAGVVGYAIARGLAVPGAAALGLWLGLWAVVPLVGSFVGALPIVVIAAAQNPWHGVAAGLFFVAYQIADDVLVQPNIHRRSMRLGPFLTTLVGVGGLELYGLGGALVATLAVALVVAALAEMATLREADAVDTEVASTLSPALEPPALEPPAPEPPATPPALEPSAPPTAAQEPARDGAVRGEAPG